ncbi:hypothetical protein FRC11_007049 [Ceratobasidium sp. 423]|nr:hypothetical protein FRC11_007049 [Ceratobasidium sp. 423]
MSEKDSVNLEIQRQFKQTEREIEQISHTLSQTPDDDPNMPLLFARLGKWHGERFDIRGEREDIDKAIEYTSSTLSMTPDNDPSLPGLLDKLRKFHGNRYMRLNNQEDSDKELEYASRAIWSTPDGHPELPRRLGNLGKAHSNRFQHLGDPGDLKRAIEHISRAVALVSSDHPHLPHLLYALGVCHSDRFLRLGDLHDIEKAIEVQSRAVASTPNGDPDLSNRLASLALSHKNRFNRLDELDDLDKAIECESRALTLTPDGHPDLPSRLGNLGASHLNQFERLGRLGDLEKAIEYQSRAVALIPDDHPEFSNQLANLAVSHGNRFRHLNELGDLEKAIEYETRVLNLTPDGHPDLPDRLHNLGVSHAYRFELLGMQHDFHKVIECMSSALRWIPEGHPSLPDKHFPLAGYRFLKYRFAGDPSDLQHSLGSFRIASQSPVGSPRNKFKYASMWAGLASEDSSLNPIEAYQATINLLPQFIWLGATTNQRYQDLEQVQNIAIRAAAAAIIASNYKLALEWLEHARCVVWNQNLMLRSPLDQLHVSHPTLATRLQTVANQLHRAGSESRESQALSGSITPEQVAQQHRRLAKEYDELISQARALPGFENFLQPLLASDLVKAARDGPIVAINCHNDRCDALVVLPGRDTIDHIPLPNFTGETAQCARLEMDKLVRNSRLRERGANRRPLLDETFDFGTVLADLWDGVVKPILDFLGYTINDPKDNLPHITWCPTGALSFLPLHAAGDYSRPRSRVFDYVISSYTPTLTALLTSSSSSVNRNTRVLGIGQPKTPGHTPLPGTVTELAHLKSHTLAVEYTQLLDDQATVAGVLDAMEQHDWVHLVCHAHQNVQDPTKSGFFLHDDTLDLASINRRSFKGKGLAYLSACQTATGDEKLPDEAVHLASGLLMAGYSSVIATMWSVVDEDAPLVADNVYGQLMRGGKLGNGEAGRALHSAVAELRERLGEKAFQRWVPYIHIGS